MKRTLFVALFLIPILTNASTDPNTRNGVRALREQKKTMATPDIPGNLNINLGFNFLYDKPSALDEKFWGSKSVGLYYNFNINPKGTFFSINTGLGLGLEKYALEDKITLVRGLNADGVGVAVIDTLGADVNGHKSKLVANYIEIPLEIRIYTNTKNREKGAFFAFGASAGLLYQSFTKLKFTEDGVDSKIKNTTDLEFNRFRATAFFRLGYRGFNFFYRLGLTEIFKTDKGPSAAPVKSFTVGLAFIGF